MKTILSVFLGLCIGAALFLPVHPAKASDIAVVLDSEHNALDIGGTKVFLPWEWSLIQSDDGNIHVTPQHNTFESCDADTEKMIGIDYNGRPICKKEAMFSGRPWPKDRNDTSTLCVSSDGPVPCPLQPK